MLILFDFSSNIILPSRRPTNLSEYFLAKSTWWRLHKIVVPKSLLIFFNIDKINRINGMDITFVTSANTDKEAKSLLTELGLPFKKN